MSAANPRWWAGWPHVRGTGGQVPWNTHAAQLNFKVAARQCPLRSYGRDEKLSPFLLDPVDRAIGDEHWRGKDELELFKLTQFRFKGIKRVDGKTSCSDPKFGGL